MGIEPTYPAWKAGVLPLNYTRRVGVTGFEPATSWSQTRRSSQAEPHPDIVLCFRLIRKTRVIILQAKGKVNTFFYFFYFFFFWCLMYLYPGFIHCRRCSLGNWCICTALIFAFADTLFQANVSTTCSSLNLQMLFSVLGLYNCICILPFLELEDTSFANFASTSHVFDNVRMLLSKITHPQPTLSIPCRYSPVKLCILNLLFQCFADTPHQNFASSIP